ncbi:Tox-REase-5 domain-containing protein, partial [Photorhabdus australis]
FQCLKVTFDGWRPAYCLFLEAKARYDQFFKGKEPKKWWRGVFSAQEQAERHQKVCDALECTPYVEWHFLQPISCAYFKIMFSKHKNISVHYTPCNSLV